MSSKVSPTLIGGFVVGAITLCVAGLMFLSSGPLFRKSEAFVLFFEGSVAGLRTGAPVKFKGVEVGQVTGVYLDMGRSEEDTVYSIPVTIEIFEDRVRARGGRVDLDDPEWADEMIENGFRGQLLAEVAKLEARQKMVEVAQSSSEFNLDSSSLARANQLVRDIESRLEVTERLLNEELVFADEIPLDGPESEDVVQQIADYFGDNDDLGVAAVAAEVSAESKF